MANDMTPRAWPSESRGLMDDAAEAARAKGTILPARSARSARSARLVGTADATCMDGAAGAVTPRGPAGWVMRFLEGLAFRLAPLGGVTASLSRGQALALHGARLARVECLEGLAWVTCPSDGRDLVLEAGQAVRLRGTGPVAVSAAGGPARVRLGWK